MPDISPCVFADIHVSMADIFLLRFFADISCGGHLFFAFLADIPACSGHSFFRFLRGHILSRTFHCAFFEDLPCCGHFCTDLASLTCVRINVTSTELCVW